MITEYYDEFNNQFNYKFVGKKLVNNFEKWLKVNEIPLDESYYYIEEYTDSLRVSNGTKRTYRTRLRRFIEYIYGEKEISILNLEEDLIW